MNKRPSFVRALIEDVDIGASVRDNSDTVCLLLECWNQIGIFIIIEYHWDKWLARAESHIWAKPCLTNELTTELSKTERETKSNGVCDFCEKFVRSTTESILNWPYSFNIRVHRRKRFADEWLKQMTKKKLISSQQFARCLGNSINWLLFIIQKDLYALQCYTFRCDRMLSQAASSNSSRFSCWMAIFPLFASLLCHLLGSDKMRNICIFQSFPHNGIRWLWKSIRH